MSWGFKSFLSSLEAMASTLKLPEGDELNIAIQANAAGNIVAGQNRTFAVTRRYLPGSDVDYRHFNEYNGGLKSNNKFYNEHQYLATTVVNQWTQAWRLQIIRNEAYKIFTGGVLPDVVNLAVTPQVSHLVESKILIDDPLWEYNKYFTNHEYNNLPFIDSNSTYSNGLVAAAYPWKLEKKHRFTPTIDVLKNRNRDLTVYVKDDGNHALRLYTVMTGVKFQI
jgi:hypothetical protein